MELSPLDRKEDLERMAFSLWLEQELFGVGVAPSPGFASPESAAADAFFQSPTELALATHHTSAVATDVPLSTLSLPPRFTYHDGVSYSTSPELHHSAPIFAEKAAIMGMFRVSPPGAAPPWQDGAFGSHSLVLAAPLYEPLVTRSPTHFSISQKADHDRRRRALGMALDQASSHDPHEYTTQNGRRGSPTITPLCNERSTLAKSRSRAQLQANTSVSYGGGCRLDLVKQDQNAALLPDYDDVTFPNQKFTQKASLRFSFTPYKPFNRQYNVLLRGNKQPTRRRLAEVTVRAVEDFIKECAERGQPFPYKLEHLVLLRIEVVSRSSIRPVFNVIPVTV